METAAYVLLAFLMGYVSGRFSRPKREARSPDPIEPLCTENLSTHIPPRSVYPREEG